MSNVLEKAIAYEKTEGNKIKASERPAFHLSPKVGWMNDPNGFSCYDGKYHLFYQYYPYDTQWGPMHWGHAVSEDMIRWSYLPAALAPDSAADKIGCFSGSAIQMPDGRQLLLYTGVHKEEEDRADSKDVQEQCIAFGDGKTYRKYENNPVITREMLPPGASVYDFRDPKIWKEDDGYYCVVGSCTEEKDGQILLFRSPDGIEWQFEKILIRNNKRFGKMWECPDFFELDGKQVLITSPQEMLPEGLEFHNGNGTLYVTGTYGSDHEFLEESYGTIDYGIDFYAPQTTCTADGRRVMIGWMQNWDTLSYKPEFPWFGQMSIPRELEVRNGKLWQRPVREIEHYYGRRVEHHNVKCGERMNLPGIEGRCVDLEISVRPADEKTGYRSFEIRFADNGTYYVSVIYDPYASTIQIDRKHCGTRKATIHQRRAYVTDKNGEIRLRMIIDRYSAEVFVNDGEQVLSVTFYTDITASGIHFTADGEVLFDAVMHELSMEENA